MDTPTPERHLKFKLSTTERQEFHDCRRRWDIFSYSRQSLEMKQEATALWFGKLGHDALEHFEKSRVDLVKHFSDSTAAAIEKLTSEGIIPAGQDDWLWELREIGIGMMHGYLAIYPTLDAGFKTVYTEHEFELPILDHDGNHAYVEVPVELEPGRVEVCRVYGYIVGRIDRVVEDTLGMWYVMDYKFMADRLASGKLDLDDQLTSYMYCGQRLFNRPFAGAVYRNIRKKLPTIPRLLVGGKGLSKDKSVDTTYEVYRKAIDDAGLNPADYADILQHLLNKPNSFFQQETVRRNQSQLDTFEHELYYEFLDMAGCAERIYHSPSWMGCFCDAKALCLATNDGSDVEAMKRDFLKPRVPEGVYGGDVVFRDGLYRLRTNLGKEETVI